MKFPRAFACLLPGVILALTVGCEKAVIPPTAAPIDLSEPKQAQPRLQTIELWLGAAQIRAELALTPQQIRTGMMFRTEVAENEGMLFVLAPHRASFWMKNCPVPLSVAYIDPDGVIQEIHNLEPHNTNSVVAASENIAYALETARSWFARHDVRVGMTVRSARGELRDIFQRRR